MEAVNTISIIIFIIGILCLLAAIVFTVLTYHKKRAMILRLRRMLDEAVNGTFKESCFDESLYSAVENRLAEYLNASEISARKTAEERDRIKTLIADISHQTKTPISNIIIYTELLKEQELSGEVMQSVELLESQAHKLGFLIASLVKLSRLETGIITLHPRENSIAGLLEEVYRQFRQKAEEKGLYLRIEEEGLRPEGEDWPLKRGDRREITAVFDEKWTAEALGNVVDNAIKYTKTGGITVRVRPFEMFVGIEVADTGAGISEEEHAKIFGRFYRSPKVSGEDGVGIGLYLVRQILQMEGGYIKVASEAGRGARFTIYLCNRK